MKHTLRQRIKQRLPASLEVHAQVLVRVHDVRIETLLLGLAELGRHLGFEVVVKPNREVLVVFCDAENTWWNIVGAVILVVKP